MTKLFMRAALANLRKPNLHRIEITSRGLRTGRFPISRNGYRLRPDVLRVQRRFTILQEHSNNLLEIAMQRVQRLTLAVRPRETRHVAHV